jgi:hypothetical protein
MDAALHQYFAGQVRVPSVTEMLRDAGLIDDRWFREEHAERGRVIHDLAARLDLGVALDEAQRVDAARYVGYLSAYEETRDLLGPIYSHVEEMALRRDLGFAGTPDRLGTGTRSYPDRDFVLDLKTGAPRGWHGVQLALYDILATSPLTESRRRIGLYVTAKGTGRVKVYSDPKDYRQARAILRDHSLARAAQEERSCRRKR